MDPSLAAVIPAWNAEDFIADAIESVLEQTHPVDEIVVVDDGSQDDTASVVRQFGTAVRLVQTDHGGSAAARNAGASATESEYLAYLDADDLWKPKKVERFRAAVDALERPGFLFSDFRRVVLETKEVRASNTEIFPWIRRVGDKPVEVEGVPVSSFPPEEALTLLLRGYPVFPSSMAFRRDLLHSVGHWDPAWTRAQDFEVCLRMAHEGGAVYLDEELTQVRTHKGHGPGHDWVVRQLDWNMKILAHHLDSGYFPSRIRPLIQRYLSERVVSRGDTSRLFGRRLEALRWYIRALGEPGQRIRGIARLLETLSGIDRVRHRDSYASLPSD